MALLPGRLQPWAQPGFDRGAVPADAPVGLVTVFLSKTAAQQADLNRLLENQQNPSSPDYHRWLTPEEYGARFGSTVHDATAVAGWLRSQGLKVERVARGRNWVAFTGTATLVEQAFHTKLHRYAVNGVPHIAPYREMSIPEALAPVVDNVAGLDDWDSAPRHAPRYNASGGGHGLSPDDFAVIYNAAPLYAAGFTGAGQKIAIAGSSDVQLSDVQMFRSFFGLAPNDPQFVVYGPDPGFNGSQGENTGDIEGAMMVARDATVILVSTTNPNASVAHAVDDQIAPVISFSYGDCEAMRIPSIGQFRVDQVRSTAQQANVEGITWVAASGDYGAAGCDTGVTGMYGLAADFPASIPEITAVGATQFAEGNGAYWNSIASATGESARSYIPEAAWNETTSTFAQAVTGGGSSILYSKPAWQVAPGVPQDGARDIPDISFNGAEVHDPDLGFLNGVLLNNSGSSVASPAFAGVLALLNQYLTSKGVLQQPGLGNVNPTLYRMARNAPGVFHDVTVGNTNRPCKIGTPDCISGVLGYSAGPGYDLATGLGSLDIFNFVTQWTAARAPSVTTLTAGAPSVAWSGSIPLTVAVTSLPGSPAATGTVVINAGAQKLGTLALASVPAVFTLYASQLSPGASTITAVYSGDANLDGSSGSASVTITVPASNSVIVPAVSPNPVFQHTQPDSSGNNLFFTLSLTEAAGIGTTLTEFVIDGASQPVSQFFPSAAIPPKGSISTAISTAATAGSSTVYGFSGVDAGGFKWREEITAEFLGPELLAITGVANAASGSSTALAPGGIASVYGGNLSPFTLSASTVPLPLSLGGVSATVNGIPAPLYFVSPLQVNLQLPYELQPGTGAIVIDNNGQTGVPTPPSSVKIAAGGPGIFVDGNGNTAPFASGSRGQILTLFITGFGAVNPTVPTGAAPDPGTPVTQLPAPVQQLKLTIGGQPAAVTFNGIPSGLVGVMQINFQVPDNAPLGPQPVVVSVGGVLSGGSAMFTVTQ